MKGKSFIPAVLVALLIVLCIAVPVAAAQDASKEVVGQCTITNVSMYPTILKPNEEGIITFTLSNPGSTLPMVLRNIYLKYNGDDGGIVPTKPNMRNLPNEILPGKTLTLPMPIKAGNKTGTFYATICVESKDGYVFNAMQPIVVKVMENSADLLVSNKRVVDAGDYYVLSADVSNLGFITAKSLQITTLEGGEVGPYSVYPIGNLDVDDLAGFEITFTCPKDNQLTLVMTYRDADRNVVTEMVPLNVSQYLVVIEEDYTLVIVLCGIGGLIVLLIIVSTIRKSIKGKRR